MSMKILYFLFGVPLFFVSTMLHGASFSVSFGSAETGSDPNFSFLSFEDQGGSRILNTDTAVLAAGYFSSDNPADFQTFSEFYSDFSVVASVTTSVINNQFPGDWRKSSTVSGTTATSSAGQVPYTFGILGTSSFDDISSASEFMIYSDSGWPDYPTPSDTSPPSIGLQTTIAPDEILAGTLLSADDGNVIKMTAIPEPSAYATILGLLGLGYAVFCRRRRSSSTG